MAHYLTVPGSHAREGSTGQHAIDLALSQTGEAMSNTAAIEVRSPKGLTEAVAQELTKRMRKAAALLGKAVQPAVAAWVWAMQHGFEGYRPTLKAAGVEPTGHMQRCYEVARAIVETETTFEDIAASAEGDRLEDIAKAARDILKANGLVAAKGKARTSLEVAAKVIESLTKLVENLEKPASTRGKSNPGFPKPSDVPAFNVRECLRAALAGERVNITLLADVPPQAVAVMAESNVS